MMSHSSVENKARERQGRGRNAMQCHVFRIEAERAALAGQLGLRGREVGCAVGGKAGSTDKRLGTRSRSRLMWKICKGSHVLPPKFCGGVCR